MILNEKIILVTGASRGIGRAIAVDAARQGADLVLLGRDSAALEQTVAEVTAARAGTRTHILSGDVADPATTDRAVREAVEQFGRLDCAIANAGQAYDQLLMRTKPADLERMLSVNLSSAFYLCSAVSRQMMKQRSGAVVFVSSIVGLTGNVGQAAYAASKAGLIGLTKSAAKELGSRNVRVNAVAPGFIETAMTESMTPEVRARYLSTIPLGRMGTPEDISGPVTFLCSDAARYITGQTLVIDGGLIG